MAGREKTLPEVNSRQEPELPAVNFQGQSEESGGRKWYFWALVGLAALVGVFAISLIAAIAIALLADPQDAANWVGLIRDVFIIVLALEGMLMGIALIVLVIHLPRWSTVAERSHPDCGQRQRDGSTVRGTAQFMSENLVQPVVRFTAITAGAGALLRELLGIRNRCARTPTSADGRPTRKGLMGKRQEEAIPAAFSAGCCWGLLVSAPVAAWLSPYSGHRLRQTIRQRGQVIVRRAGETAQQVSHIPARITGGVASRLGTSGQSARAGHARRGAGRGAGDRRAAPQRSAILEAVLHVSALAHGRICGA